MATSVELPIYPESARFEVERKLGSSEFACDLAECKGACCTMPGPLGAPLLPEELALMEEVLPIVKKYLPERALEAIGQKGVWQREADGSFTVPTVDNEECVFVMFEQGIAYCAIERAYRNGEFERDTVIENFPKPISCHLFPIRIYPLEGEGRYEIVYEEISECRSGRTEGKAQHMPLMDFLETPLVRALGPKRLEALKRALTR